MSHQLRGQLDEAIALQKDGRLDQALARYQAVEALAADAGGGAAATALRSEALRRQASVHRTRTHWDAAIAAATRAGEVARAGGCQEQYADAVNAIALVHQARGAWDEAVRLLDEVLASSQAPRVRGVALQNLGSIAAQRGDFAEARRHFLASHACFREAGYGWGEAFVLNNFGRAAVDHGNFVVAAELLESAVGAARRVEDRDLHALATLNLAEAHAGLGDLARADELAGKARAYFTRVGNQWRESECLRLLGDIAARRGDAGAAAALYREGLLLAQRIGAAAEVALLERRLREPATRGGETTNAG